MKNLIYTLVLLTCVAGMLPAQQIYRYEFEIVNMQHGVNSAADDYSPMFSPAANRLFFNSFREQGSYGKADVYYAPFENGEFQNAQNAGRTFNRETNDGSMSLAKDGFTVAFAAADRSEGLGDTDIYSAVYKYGTLESIQNLGEPVNTGNWESQPSLTGGGMVMYFASNRAGGEGGTDIWVTRNDGWGKWSEPENLGPGINTPDDEAAPNITSDGGTLYFSSEGLSGYGGMDIFMTKMTPEGWDQPTNLGEAINTEADELYFFAPNAGDYFFFASAREGGKGGLDIYRGTPNVFGRGMFTLVVNVVDSLSDSPLPSYVDVFDVRTGEMVTTFATNTKTRDYTELLPANTNYRVEVSFKDYPRKEQQVYNVTPNESRRVKFVYGSMKLAEFDLGKYNIPFFVTGYYRPNVREHLEELNERKRTDLRGANYIERVPEGSSKYERYESYAATVEQLFDEVVRKSIDEYLPQFIDESGGEVVEYTVTGYADPQPIVGTYVENDTVSFYDANGYAYSVKQGDEMTNLLLSGLRAHHSAEYLKSALAAQSSDPNSPYQRLVDDGRIKFNVIAGGVSDDRDDFAAQRRIRVSITRKGRKTEF